MKIKFFRFYGGIFRQGIYEYDNLVPVELATIEDFEQSENIRCIFEDNSYIELR